MLENNIPFKSYKINPLFHWKQSPYSSHAPPGYRTKSMCPHKRSKLSSFLMQDLIQDASVIMQLILLTPVSPEIIWAVNFWGIFKSTRGWIIKLNEDCEHMFTRHESKRTVNVFFIVNHVGLWYYDQIFWDKTWSVSHKKHMNSFCHNMVQT